jgi:hypothetical protein
MRKLARAVNSDESGQMAIFMVLMIFVVCTFFAMSLDAGAWYFDHRTAQNQAEAAALAGILELPGSETTALAAVNDFLVKNGTDPATVGDCPTSSDSNFVEFDSTGETGGVDTVTVCVRRQSSSYFARLGGIEALHVSAMAKAQLIVIPLPYALMALNKSACSSLVVAGRGGVVVQGESESAGTYTRSTCPAGLTLEGENPRLTADGDNDTYSGSANDKCLIPTHCTPQPTKEDYIEDPFAQVEPPSVPSSCLPAQTFSSGVGNTLDPGCYLGLSVSGNGTRLTLSAGVYVMRGPVSFSGGTGTTVTSNGAEVLFYMTCSTGACPSSKTVAASTFNVAGQVTVSLKGHSDYEHITIFVDRNSKYVDSPAAVRLAGQGSQDYEGAVYAVNSHVEVEGNGTGLSLNVAIVSDTMRFAGNGAVSITYDIDLIPPEYQFALIE